MLNLSEGFIPPENKFFKTVDLDVDYFNGDWKTCSVFFKNFINFDLLKHNHNYWFNLINDLKQIQCIGIALEKITKDTEIFSHSDSDLLGTSSITRIFYPLTENEFLFEGTICNTDGTVEYKKVIDNKPVIFIPQLNHRFESYEDGYYFIIDIAKDIKELDSSFWTHYLTFCIQHYISHEYIN